MHNGVAIPVAQAVPVNFQPVTAQPMGVRVAYATAVTHQPNGQHYQTQHMHRVHPETQEVIVQHERVENNTLLAWLGCCCCPAIGLFGVYMSIKAENYARMGDVREARKASKLAKQLAMFAILAGLFWMFWRPWQDQSPEAADQQSYHGSTGSGSNRSLRGWYGGHGKLWDD
jgi:hypothetical protein